MKIDEKELKATAERTGLPEDYVRSMLEWKVKTDQRVKDAAEDAAKVGLTPEEYVDRQDIDEMTLVFLEAKGFNTSTDLASALNWIRTADPDDLMLGEGSHEDFDVTMGELRRPMLFASVERLMKKQQGMK